MENGIIRDTSGISRQGHGLSPVSLSQFWGALQVHSTRLSPDYPPDYPDIKFLKDAINAVLDHMMLHLEITSITIRDDSYLYWHCPSSELHDMSKKPAGLDIGKLSDDVDFIKLIAPGASADVTYSLVHVAPLLRYIAETVKK